MSVAAYLVDALEAYGHAITGASLRTRSICLVISRARLRQATR